MNAITEPRFMKIIFRTIPVFICIGEYAIIVAIIILVSFSKSPFIVKGLLLMLGFIGLIMIPFWYRTFFDKTFIGPDRPICVRWTADNLFFFGCYFEIHVCARDILDYQVIGFRKYERMFMIKIKMRKPNGKIETVYLSTTMHNKTDLLSFLEDLGGKERKRGMLSKKPNLKK
ncbi:MAG: hypothetical protein EOM20_05125 [Spartobacteria bacterium]|nr:hypothetical protein [Spartobacteria bacterium]